jgi:putative ABC transport system permease protein
MICHPLSTALSLILLTSGIGMISLLLQMNHHNQQQMENNLQGIDMVVGAKSSTLQLILSAVDHIDVPTGNIFLYKALLIHNNRLVASSIQLSYGDSYEGCRIEETTHDYPVTINDNFFIFQC